MTNLIIGSGPVGRIMAISLSRSGQPVHLIGPKPISLPNMAFAIHPKYFKFLQSLNITPIHQPTYSLMLNFLTPQEFNSKKPLCYIVRYNDLLFEISKQLSDIHQTYCKPTDITANCIHLPKQSIFFKNLIACDGQQSWVRNKIGIHTHHYPYNQFAHTAIITHTEPQEGISQTFRHFGTFGKLTLENSHQSAIIWSCDLKTHQYILEHGLKTSLKHFQLLNDPLLIEHHQHIPLSATLSKSYHKNNIYLAGNALHNIHPLAGIGFNLALGDIQTLTDIISFNKPPHYYPSQRKRPHTKAHWITDTVAKSRQYDEYYSIINTINQNSLDLKAIQKIALQQLSSIC